MNELINIRPQIEVIYDWMASGLIHYKRSCQYCGGEMAFKHSMYELKYNYFWICCICFREIQINFGTPFSGLNIVQADRSIILWIERSTLKLS